MQNLEKPIKFQDEEIKRICVENFGGTNGIKNWIFGKVGVKGIEGEITKKQALAVTAIRNSFFNNKKIRTFNEFHIFENAQKTYGEEFKNCENLEEITIPSNFQPSDAQFDNCKSLVKLNSESFGKFPKNVNGMFRNCNSLTYINCDNWDMSEVVYGSFLFEKCHNLKVLNCRNWDISKLIHFQSVYAYCRNLTTLYLPNLAGKNSINNLLYGCSKIENNQFPILATHNAKGQYQNGIFWKNQWITTVNASDIPNISVLGGYMFSDCYNLKYVNLKDSNSVTDMEYFPFARCTKLQGITFPNRILKFGVYWGHFYPEAPNTGKYLEHRYLRFFSETPPINLKNDKYNVYNHIYVPASAIEAYKNSNLWDANVVEIKSLEEWEADCDKYNWDKY